MTAAVATPNVFREKPPEPHFGDGLPADSAALLQARIKDLKLHLSGTVLERLIGQGLVDVGRALDPDNDGLFTWWAPWRNLRARNIGWRLDYVLANTQLAERAASCIVQKEIGTSDHAPVTATFL